MAERLQSRKRPKAKDGSTDSALDVEEAGRFAKVPPTAPEERIREAVADFVAEREHWENEVVKLRATILSQENTIEKNDQTISDQEQTPIMVQKESILVLIRRAENAEQQFDRMQKLCSELLDAISESEEAMKDHEAQKELDDKRIESLEKAIAEVTGLGRQKEENVRLKEEKDIVDDERDEAQAQLKRMEIEKVDAMDND